MKRLRTKLSYALYILLCVCFLFSCRNTETIPQKPYVIIGKESDYLTVKYRLVDKNGYVFEVTERDDNQRFVGDTIK